MIPFSDPSASYQAHKKEIDQAIDRVHNSGWFILGKEVEAFEQEFASFHGSNYRAVGVANGTDAIAICLRSMGLGRNDEVITSSHTAVATVAGIEQAGCIPVFADIDPVTRCIDASSIKKRISKKTRAIMPVHIYGQPCDMNALSEIEKEYGIKVIEDCSQAHGAEISGQKVGTFGSLAAFSCYPTKNLGGTGDGGVILCKSLQLWEKIKALRQYGWNQDRESIFQGFNSRLDELQAAILRVKLAHLETSNKKRLMIANKYNDAFQDLPITLPCLKQKETHAMHLFVIECNRRDELLTHLRDSGVGASLHYPLPVHLHATYSGRICGSEDLPVTEMFYKRHLTLPMFPELSDDAIENIISGVCKFFKN